MRIDILTLFPQMCENVLKESIIGRARERGLIEISCRDIREYTADKHRRVDDTPYGGGMGMVMQTQPIYDCFESLCEDSGRRPYLIYMSPQGKTLTQKRAIELSQMEHIALLCGHYEGVDERVIEEIVDEEISIGDYVLTGGELPAMVLIDAVARFIPDVLGNSLSTSDESVYSGLLECDQYTKPRTYQNMEVPEVLTGGNHKLIHLWQYENALNLTKQRRPDLWKKYLEAEKNLTKDEKKILEKVAAKPR